MVGRWTWGAALLAVALASSACGGGSSSPSAAQSGGVASGGASSGSTSSGVAGCDTSSAAATASTASYRYVLDIVPIGAMYGPSAVPSAHPSGAVVMFGGTMSMAEGPNARDLQVHVCQRGNNHVLTNVSPTITLKDTTAGTTQDVPIATMQSVAEGQRDFHYGNNVVLTPGHSYVATVTVQGESATLTFKAA